MKTFFRVLQYVLMFVTGYLLKAEYPDMSWWFLVPLSIVGSVLEVIAIAVIFGAISGYLGNDSFENKNEDEVKLKEPVVEVPKSPSFNIEILRTATSYGRFNDINFPEWIEVKNMGVLVFDGVVKKLGEGHYDTKYLPEGGIILDPGIMYVPKK